MEYVTLTGELDPLTALDLRVRLYELTGELRPAVTVDLSQVTAVHLAGIAALASASRRAERLSGSLTVLLPDRIDARRNFERTAWFADRSEQTAAGGAAIRPGSGPRRLA